MMQVMWYCRFFLATALLQVILGMMLMLVLELTTNTKYPKCLYMADLTS